MLAAHRIGDLPDEGDQDDSFVTTPRIGRLFRSSSTTNQAGFPANDVPQQHCNLCEGMRRRLCDALHF